MLIDWWDPSRILNLRTHYNEVPTEAGTMARSRAFNRFHRYLARQKRRDLRSALPQVQSDCSSDAAPIDRSRALINRLSGREAQLDLLEADACAQPR